MWNSAKEKLYRKVNKLVIHYRGDKGSEYRYERNTKKMKNFEGDKKSMKKKDRGMDYTPLYKFLLSKVGCVWKEVHSEAVSRLDREEPIFWMVILDPTSPHHSRSYSNGVVWLGESSQYNALTVNSDGILVKIKEDAFPWPATCSCCTYTFNGKVIPKVGLKKKEELLDILRSQRKLLDE